MHPTSKDLCKTYNKLYTENQVKFPLYDAQRNNIDSIIKTVNSSFFGVERYPTNQDKAVAYFCYIIKNHPVTDGNKRLSVMWLNTYCELNSLKLTSTRYSFDQLAVAIEKTKDIEMDELISIVKRLLF